MISLIGPAPAQNTQSAPAGSHCALLLTLSPELPGLEVEPLFLDLRLRGPDEPAKERETRSVSPRRARAGASRKTGERPTPRLWRRISGSWPSSTRGCPASQSLATCGGGGGGASARARGRRARSGRGRDVPSISCLGGLQYAKKLIAELPPSVRPLRRRTAGASADQISLAKRQRRGGA